MPTQFPMFTPAGSGSGAGITPYTTNQRDALTPTSGQVIFNTDTQRVEYWDSLKNIWRATGNPLGINYIPNNNAESSVATNWATYADAAGSAPVDGTGGVPNITWTVTTSTPLRGQSSFLLTKDAANRQGQGVSYDFSIDTADQAKVLQVSLDYQIASGTYSGGTQTTDSDLTCYLYDVTNSVVIQPAGFKFDGAVVGTNYNVKATFQTASNSTSYRLIFHIATTSASAYTVKIDSISVAPQVTSLGTIITDWVDFPSVAAGTLITGSTSNPTYGTTVTNKAQWRRVGGDMEIRWDYRQSSAGTVGSGSYLFNLPPGYVIDTTRAKANTATAATSGTGFDSPSIGIFTGGYATNAVRYGTISVYDSTKLKAHISNTNGSGVGAAYWGSGGASFADTTTETYGIHAMVPILGWGATTTVSSETDTRVVAASAYVSANFAATTSTPVNFDTVLFDTHGALTPSATVWKYTAPVPGYYSLTAFGFFTASSSDGLIIYKNGVANTNLATALSGSGLFTGTASIQLNAGDYIDIRPTASKSITGGAATTNNAARLTIQRLSGPAQIASSETIAARIGGDPASASSGNPVIFPTVSYDTHGSYNTTTGRYTCSAPGIYEMGGQISSANTAVGLFLYLNAVSNVKVGSTDSNGEASYLGAVRCVAGDIIDLRPNNTLDADSTSVVYFKRIGA